MFLGIAGETGNWKVDPDHRQDRKPSKIKTYKLTPEEIEQRYGHIVLPEKRTSVKPFISEEIVSIREIEKERVEMPQKKVEFEKLKELCREHGFGKASYEKIGAIIGTGWHTIECYVSKWGLKKLILDEVKIVSAAEGEQTELKNEVDLEQKEEVELKKENLCRKCGLPTNYNAFTLCDKCWDEKHSKKPEKVKVYIASSWRNINEVREWTSHLRAEGFEVFDFTDENDHFVFWIKDIPGQANMDIIDFLNREESQKAFDADCEGMKRSNVCLLLLPSGKSAHLEAGFMKGAGKKLIIYQDVFPKGETDVMYKFADLITDSVREVVKYLKDMTKQHNV